MSDASSVPTESKATTVSSIAKPYSVPRRFSLKAILVVMAAYAVLFCVLAALRVPNIITINVAIFITAVGLAQAFLFGGKKPRSASIIAGGVVAGLLLGGQTYWSMLDPKYPEGIAWAPYAAIMLAIFGAVHGLIFGYVVGAILGVLFAWADNSCGTSKRNTAATPTSPEQPPP